MCHNCIGSYKGFLDTCYETLDFDSETALEEIINDDVDIEEYKEFLQNGSFDKKQLQKLIEIGYADYLNVINAVAEEDL